MTIETLLFYFFSILAVISGSMVIFSKNPIHSVLSLILVFVNTAALLIILNVEFLAMLFLVVYVGAIAVLFLFVVMMLNIKLIEVNENRLRYLPVGILIGIIFLAEIFLIVEGDIVPLDSSVVNPNTQLMIWASNIDNVTNIEAIGLLLYTHYFYFFIVAGLILLVAMIGAIILTLNVRSGLRRQVIFEQLSRDFETTVKIKR